MTHTIHVGDCLTWLATIADNSMDAVVTDPPYGLSDHKPAEVRACLAAWLAGEPYRPKGKGFMGKGWDAWVPGPEVWGECLRVLKPGGYLLAFAGTRSMDLMSMALRLAGFELRDAIGYTHDDGGAPLAAWCYGSGFPKSHDVAKAIDKRLGQTGGYGAYKSPDHAAHRKPGNERMHEGYQRPWRDDPAAEDRNARAYLPGSEEAQAHQGKGTALKPAWEPILLARKPLDGTVADTVLTWGTGALNIDDCRIGTEEVKTHGQRNGKGVSLNLSQYTSPDGWEGGSHSGRWPANVIHDGSDAVLREFARAGVTTRPGSPVRNNKAAPYGSERTWSPSSTPAQQGVGYTDTGSAARFFYCAKASRRDRDEGLDGFEPGARPTMGSGIGGQPDQQRANNYNIHPTVKPTALMRYLVRLVTPEGGTVLDPFTGSGSTGKGAVLEGRSFVGIELDPAYARIAAARIAHAAEQQAAYPVQTPLLEEHVSKRVSV